MVLSSSDARKIGTVLEQSEQIVAALQADSQMTHDFYTIKSLDGLYVLNIGVCKRASNEGYDFFVADCPLENSGVMSKQAFMRIALEEIPTDYDTTIVAVDRHSGRILGITVNNEQDIWFNRGSVEENMLSLLSNVQENTHRIINVNGRLAVMVVQNYDEDIALVGFDTMNSASYREIAYSLVKIVLGIVGGYVLTFLSFKRMIKNTFIKDIQRNEIKIRQVLDGDYSVEFEKGEIDEMNNMVETICELKDGYVHKAERMNLMFNAISPDIAAFELLAKEQYSVFTNNLKRIMGLSEHEFIQYKTNIYTFRTFISKLRKQADGKNIVYFRDRYLSIHLYEIGDEMMGVIIDRTQEERARREMKSSLSEERKKSYTDELTGIMNRRGFLEKVQQLIRLERGGVLLICDLDNFKRINDSLGHLEGDKALKLFASVLKWEFRSSDVIGRIGGDEFMVYLSSALKDSLIESKMESVMESTRQAMKAYKEYDISVSIGISQIDVVTGVVDFKSLYESADTALYIAKETGKNKYYINKSGIRCMKTECVYCREQCPRRDILLKPKETGGVDSLRLE